MKSLDIEIAVMKYLGIRANLIVPNVSWGMFLNNRVLHECDILSLSKTGYATEVEIKVSKYDLLKDKEKWHGHYHNHIAHLFFAVPQLLEGIALANIPERAGLLIAEKYHDRDVGIKLIKPCRRNKNAVKWSDKEIYKLARLGTLRILGLKQKIRKLQNQQLI